MNNIFTKGYNFYRSLFRKGDPLKSTLAKGGLGLDLHDVMRNGYQDESSQEQFGKDKGFIYDKELSTPTEQFYVNPETNKLLMNIRGTSSVDDLITDFEMLRGKLKDTERYKRADNSLKSAKEKYKNYDTTITSHSLGGAIGTRIASPDDRSITFNRADIGGKQRKNQINIRTSGDLISSYGLLGNHYHTLGIGTLDNPIDWWKTHKSNILKGRGLFI